MGWLKIQRTRENPRDTLIRYALAIDTHFDEATASTRQRQDRSVLIQAIQSAKEAQDDAQQSVMLIRTRVGVAMGLCEAYIGLYNVPVPDVSI